MKREAYGPGCQPSPINCNLLLIMYLIIVIYSIHADNEATHVNGISDLIVFLH